MVDRISACLLVLLVAGVPLAEADVKIEDLGVPVKGVNWVRLIPGVKARGEEALYASMGQTAGTLFVLQIDPATGAFTQHLAPPGDHHYPTAAIWGPDDRLYIGAAHSAHLLRFDPKNPGIEDLGAIDPHDMFPCRIDAAPDGSLWIGCYGTASLTRFDPATGEFKRFGRLDEVDKYAYPLVAPDGIVASAIRQTRPHVVLLDPKTGEKKTVGPVVEAGQNLDIYRGTDGQLYITTPDGTLRIRGMSAQPVEQPPDRRPAPTLADGSTFRFADASIQEFRRLAITTPEGETREFTLDYEAGGTDVFLVHLGPDGKIYGSSALPLHLFRYDPKTGDLKDLGRCTTATGEAYSMGNYQGKLYICSYGGAVLSVYDPSRPYHFGSGEGDNPRDLGEMDPYSLRPRAMLAGPLGRIWTGSYPNYGIWGGPLASYDPATGEKKYWRHILPDQSVISLAWLPDLGLIACATSVSGGSGTDPKATEAALFLWDPYREKAIWIGAPRPGMLHVNALLAGHDSVVFGTAAGRKEDGFYRLLFAFDARRREFLWSRDVLPVLRGGVRDGSLQWGPDGFIYGATGDVLFRFRPDGTDLEEVVRIDHEIGVPGPLVGRTFYFATGHRLRRLTLP